MKFNLSKKSELDSVSELKPKKIKLKFKIFFLKVVKNLIIAKNKHFLIQISIKRKKCQVLKKIKILYNNNNI